MTKFMIQPHGRLQEWIAHEKGYFREEGLDYEFQRGPSSDTKKRVDTAGEVTDLMAGAFESYEKGGGNKGVKSDISRMPLDGQPGRLGKDRQDVG